ncbi:30S ribosomal protein S7 [Candidatus Nitronereus thalassa]|uniref:Small ribosomal subunit protein uS7 n=1 Tax=Candidatus Nitronereus thalassa TaxID=3020898 RepID=A0ABU3KBU8_9BACT|nr:30S ribosomal protein S7 [Candidatus Nitronereus thalassa]MDT7043861.1 30S ribosomal protein S7 [Candidatus Nitronereus thalassa]
MARGQSAGHRTPPPDSKFRDALVGKFINILMSRGKKSTAQAVCYGAFEMVESKTGGDPLKVFHAALGNVKPMVEVKSRRVGGASYQVPVEIRPVRQMALAFRWIKQSALSRSGRSMEEKLAAELMDAANSAGAAVKKRDETHRMAEANRAFAHYRW